MFWLWTSNNPRPARACAVGDEIVGLDIIPRREGRTCGPGHFGLQVEDIEEAKTRIYVFDPSIRTLKRPPVRPFGAYSAHDPDINIFDLSAKSLQMQKDLYADELEKTKRRFKHFALRTAHAERCAEFYHEVFGLSLKNKDKDDPNFYLSDGNMTLAILQWDIDDYYGMDPRRTGHDHMGFKVESLDRIKEDLEDLTGQNPICGSGH